jgi:putative flippase GtrA
LTSPLSRRREQVLYLVVGGWNTVFGYGVWALLQYLLGAHLHYLVIVALSWPIAVLNAYCGYRVLVFRSQGSVLRELPRFSVVYLAALAVNLALLPVALAVLPFTIYLVQALFTALVVVGSYLGHRYFSFRNLGRSADHDLASYPPDPGPRV